MMYPDSKDYRVARALDEYLKTGKAEHVEEISAEIGRLNLKAKLVSENGNFHQEEVPDFFNRIVNEISMMQSQISSMQNERYIFEDFLRELDVLAADTSVSYDLGERIKQLTSNLRYKHGLNF